MSQIPRNAARRTARLASIPLGAAGRSAVGLGRRARGESAEVVNEEMRRRTAEQLFAVLGSLKGGAMKVGQTLSVLEAAMPEDLVEPYREMLVRLQDAAPPMDQAEVRRILDLELGRDWRTTQIRDLTPEPVAAASIGQVHRGTWHDGRTVAVKIQYPGADYALRSDLQQLARLARVMGTLAPGMDVKAATTELLERADEELDYPLEARNQQTFADAYAGDDEVAVPAVVMHTEHVLVTEWLDGVPLSQIIREADQEVRDTLGTLYLELAEQIDEDVVLVCRSGARATRAGEALSSTGLPHLHVLDGGVQAWEAAGGDLVRGDGTWDLDRQVRLVAGGIVLTGVLASTVLPAAKWVSAGIGAGLTGAALTDTCAMGMMLSRLPHNRRHSPELEDVLAQLRG
ncbi:AarF/UbiB family protein [Janibacter melonis]|uniref:AarF/UbiB family protein n=1 Tax=Janibacter melonis TaxID=262209 RepID=UPI00174C43E9|nr:AarF/UbiB family protein [Janibacter melonis]